MTDQDLVTKPIFSGFKWSHTDSSLDSETHQREITVLESVNWDALKRLASKTRDGIDCKLMPDIGLGYNHMVRLLEFKDRVRLVARLRLPPRAGSDLDTDALRIAVESEVHTMNAVGQNTDIQVPQVYAFEAGADCDVGVPFILMECLEGNAGVDLGDEIPVGYKERHFRDLAKIQVGLSQMQLRRIGKITGFSMDGFEQGPIPGIGGPFDTAAEFYTAWSKNVIFGTETDRVREIAGSYAEEIIAAIASFQKSVAKLAGAISLRNDGPFPLFHGDFGHHNIIFDDNYHAKGLIDFESSFACPHEMVSIFPMHLMTVPSTIDAPWNYDTNGNAVPLYLAQKLADQKAYVKAVEMEESQLSASDSYSLSRAMHDSGRQQFVTALWMFQDGKPGLYANLIEKYAPEWQLGG